MAGYSWKFEKVIKDEKSGVFDKVPSQKHEIWTPPQKNQALRYLMDYGNAS